MLTPADDFLLHQIPEPMAHVGTSDRNFYDRYYFNLHNCSDELFAVFGLGQYPNLGTTDAFATVSIGGSQIVVRASRELGGDRLDTTVGPIGVEVLEGLRRFRVACEPNEWGVSFDLEWEADVAAYLEPSTTQRHLARIVSQTQRITQTGRWSGTLTVDGRTFDVTPDRWWGSRDHSWGIRSVGEPEPAGIRAAGGARSMAGRMGGGYHLWTTIQLPDSAILTFLAAGSSVRTFPAGAGRDIEHLPLPKVDLRLVSGTRVPESATLVYPQPEGDDLTVEVDCLRTVFLSSGTGYGGDASWVHGMYQGPLKVEGLRWDVGDPAVVSRISGLNDTLARFDADGRTGYGVFETLVFGRP